MATGEQQAGSSDDGRSIKAWRCHRLKIPRAAREVTLFMHARAFVSLVFCVFVAYACVSACMRACACARVCA